MKNKSKFSQVCVWPGTVVGAEKVKDFEQFIKKEFGVRVKYIEEILTSPDVRNGFPVEGTGGRNDLFFKVHSDDIMKFAIPRLQVGIRWVEDVLDNEGGMSLYPERVVNYRTW